MQENSKRALILVDMQNDFCPGGALAVPDGDAVIAPANRLAAMFNANGDIVVATQDYHPADHGSFASQHPGVQTGEMIKLAGLDQVAWPDHCVAHTKGAELHPDLKQDLIHKIITKGTDKRVDSYSGFYDNDHSTSTGLNEFLQAAGVEEVWVCGLATDYCVMATALDARALGYHTVILPEACRAIDVNAGDGAAALDTLSGIGCGIIEDISAIK